MTKTPTTPDPRWEQCLRIIHNNVSEQQYQTWFAAIRSASFDEEQQRLTIGVPSAFVYEYLEEHFASLLSAVLGKVYGKVGLAYQVVVDDTSGASMKIAASDDAVLTPRNNGNGVAQNKSPQPTQELDSNLNPHYTFRNFVVGLSNKLPATVGKAIAEHPNQSTFNPFFLYGPSGCGKTHLVTAIGTTIKEMYPQKRVLYVSAHLFQVQFTDSRQHNTFNEFIHFYQSIDVLIIDDIQEFTTPATQQAFFHIFNHLQQNGRQIILTSDRPPIALQGIEDRMLTRFKWGLLAELERPDLELRKDILRDKIRRDGLDIPEDVLCVIANRVTDSVRDLEGIVNALMANSVVLGKDIDMALAEKVITRICGKTTRKEITIDHILDQTSAFLGLKTSDITSQSRRANIVEGRQMAIYMAQKLTQQSTTRIGAAIGGRTHATVIHSCKSIEQRLADDDIFRSRLEDLEAMIRG